MDSIISDVKQNQNLCKKFRKLKPFKSKSQTSLKKFKYSTKKISGNGHFERFLKQFLVVIHLSDGADIIPSKIVVLSSSSDIVALLWIRFFVIWHIPNFYKSVLSDTAYSNCRFFTFFGDRISLPARHAHSQRCDGSFDIYASYSDWTRYILFHCSWLGFACLPSTRLNHYVKFSVLFFEKIGAAKGADYISEYKWTVYIESY